MTIIVGVDPGINGGIGAILAENGIGTPYLFPWKMPVFKSSGRKQIDIQEIAHGIIPVVNSKDTVFFVERSQPMPPKMGGGIANFQRGVARGWEWLLIGLEIPFYMIPPKTWQKEMLDGIEGKDTKQKSLIAASRIFPTIEFKKHHGSSDAMLIAEYGRRRLKV